VGLDLALGLFRVTPFGGLERQALELARAALARGFRVRLYTRRFEAERPTGLEVEELPTRALTNLGLDRAFERAFAAALAARPADLVLGFNLLAGLDAYYAADPCHAATRGRPGRLPLPALRARNARERALFAPSAAAHAFVLTASELARYRAHYGTPLERLHLLPPGLRAEFLAASGERSRELRHALGLAPSARVLLAVGSDFRRKGLDRTLAALAEVRAPEVVLLVVGAGRSGAYERRARSLGLDARFVGGVADVLPYYRAADLLVHPARVENTGTVLLEAASQGVAVLASGACGYASLVADAGAGVALAEPFSAREFAATLARLLADADARRRHGASGRLAASRWSATERSARMLSVLEELAPRRAAAGGAR
jgi:UDP-glucose:(heptosyl)LPS alpha-1,3-glucosyltransferase